MGSKLTFGCLGHHGIKPENRDMQACSGSQLARLTVSQHNGVWNRNKYPNVLILNEKQSCQVDLKVRLTDPACTPYRRMCFYKPTNIVLKIELMLVSRLMPITSLGFYLTKKLESMWCKAQGPSLAI